MPRHRQEERAGERHGQRPGRRQPVIADGRQVASRHGGEADPAGDLGGGGTGEAGDGHPERQGHEQRAQQQQRRRIEELGVGGAGDHPPDRAERAIGPAARRAASHADPDAAPPALDRPGQRAIVDERAPDRAEAADLGERGGLHEDASTGGRGEPASASVHQAEGVKQTEEIDESGHQELFPAAFHPQRRHQRDQGRAASFLPPKQGPDHSRRERDVRVQQQDEWRFHPAAPLFEGPQLAAPSLRQRYAAQDFEGERGRGSPPRRLGRAVARPVVDQDRVQAAALAGERGEGAADQRRLVARRDQDGDAGEIGIAGCRLQRLADAPGLPRQRQDAEPEGGARRGEAGPETLDRAHRRRPLVRTGPPSGRSGQSRARGRKRCRR